MTSISIGITPTPPGTDPGWTVHLKVGVGNQEPKSRWVATLVGVEADYLDSLVEGMTHAWQYGEDTRDVVRKAAEIHRLARRHRRAHEY